MANSFISPHSHVSLYGEPIALEWAGWRTDTHRLARSGWNISADQDVCLRQMVLAIHHEHHGQGMSRVTEDWLRDRRTGGTNRDYPWHLDMHMARHISVHGSEHMRFSAVDPFPSPRPPSVSPLSDLAHFRALPPVETVHVLHEPDVNELLSMILEKQQAAKTEYFRDLVRREGSVLPAYTQSAQIIMLKDAA